MINKAAAGGTVNVKVSQVKLEQKLILSHSPSPIPPSPKTLRLVSLVSLIIKTEQIKLCSAKISRQSQVGIPAVFPGTFEVVSYTSGFWPRVRARALRAPVFLSSLPPPNGALCDPPSRSSQLHCFLFDPQKYIKSIQLWPPTSRTFFFPLYRRGYVVPCPPSRPFRQYFGVKSIYQCDHTH
jgi:hypothetical protein